ncbi:hypothetical protein ACWCXH_34180 [Kitasatospora sp. NPDC001660]
MTAERTLDAFLRTGQFGAVRVGVPWSGLRALLGEPDARIEGDNPVFKYADLEIYVAGRTGTIWMVQLESFDAVSRLPAVLGLAEALRLPADRDGFVQYLEAHDLAYRVGEFHVAGQEEIAVRDSGVMVFFHEDGSFSAMSVTDRLP